MWTKMKELIFDGSFFICLDSIYSVFCIWIVQILRYGCQLLVTTASLGFVVMNLPFTRFQNEKQFL